MSLIKIGSLSKNFNYNQNDIIKLAGIAKTPIFTLGSLNLKIVEQNTEFEHKFHLVSDDFLIPSNGIIGKDFLKRFKCLVDYGEMIITIGKSDNEFVKVPIQSELFRGISAPRSETFKIFHIESEKFPCVIEPQEIEKGILVPSSIVYQPQSWVRVLNTHDGIKIINTEAVKASPITDFHILQTQENDSYATNRLKKLQSTLRKKIPEFMRSKVVELCTNFSDIFHVEGDKSSTNNFYEQKLITRDNEPVFTKNYRLPHAQKSEINRQVKILLENDLIELSTSPYNSPVIIVPNKRGMCNLAG